MESDNSKNVYFDMKKVLLLFCAMFISYIATASEKSNFYKFIEAIEWNLPREKQIEKYRDIIIPDSLVDKSSLLLRGSLNEYDIFIKNVQIEGILSENVVLKFYQKTELMSVVINYAIDSESGSDETEHWNNTINHSLKLNLGERFTVGFFGYYFHNNCLISDISITGMSCRSLHITQPSPRYDKDFRIANWGDSKEKIMSLEGKINMSSDRDLYYFDDRLGELKCRVIYKFTSNKLIWAKYLFEDIKDDMAIYHYQRFERMLDEKYGIAEYDGTSWKDDKYKETYKDDEIKAVKYGYLKKCKIWCNGPTIVYLGLITNDLGGWYLAIEYSGREIQKIQDKAVFDAL